MSGPVETRLADLTQVPLSELRKMRTELDSYQKTLIDQVEKGRANLGTGPPGRVD